MRLFILGAGWKRGTNVATVAQDEITESYLVAMHKDPTEIRRRNFMRNSTLVPFISIGHGMHVCTAKRRARKSGISP